MIIGKLCLISELLNNVGGIEKSVLYYFHRRSLWLSSFAPLSTTITAAMDIPVFHAPDQALGLTGSTATITVFLNIFQFDVILIIGGWWLASV